MGRHIITLTTDFGAGGSYVAQMKGVILSVNPRATLVDVTHAVPPHDIPAGALVLDEACRRFPPDSIHVAVVDPGVGTRRALIAARVGEQMFLAPDNGLLSYVARREPPALVVRLESPQYWSQPVSSTFHGRDILAPVAGHLSRGLDPRRLGPPHERLAVFETPSPRGDADRVAGEVVHIDSFGNLVTNITASLLPPAALRARCVVHCGGAVIAGLNETYGECPVGAAVALIGSSGRLEIAVVRGDAATQLAARRGDPVDVSWRGPDANPRSAGPSPHAG